MRCMETDLKHLTSQKPTLYQPARGMIFFFFLCNLFDLDLFPSILVIWNGSQGK